MKRALLLLLAAVMVFTSVNIPVRAEENDLSTMFAYSASDCFAKVQPTSALHLENDTIEITKDMLSPNYAKGVVDLPRLRQNYYYAIDSLNSEFYLGLTVYPTLYWTPAAKGTTATLCIYDHTEGTLMHSFEISIANDVEGIAVADFSDCSSGLVQALVDSGDNMRKYGITTTEYDPSLHKECIVMYNYIYAPDKDVFAGTDVPYTGTNFDKLAFTYSRRNISASGLHVQNNIKDYIIGNNSLESTYLFAGSKFDQCYYDNNTGVATTYTTLGDTDPLYSFIAIDNKCYFYKVTTDVIQDAELTKAAEGNKNQLTWTSSTRSTIDISKTGFTNYEPWWQWSASVYQVGLYSKPYSFTPSNLQTYENVNIYSYSLMFAGVDPHYATLTLKPYPRVATIAYYVQNPVTGNYGMIKSDRVSTEDLDDYELMEIPTEIDYIGNGWYTDVTLSQKFSKDMIDRTANSTWNLYATYKWDGGDYTVDFVNEMDVDFFQEEKYPRNKLPDLPEVKSDKFGYTFKEWRVVPSQESTAEEGTVYDPNTFQPQRDQLYIFKAFWQDMGHVVDATTDRPNRYVGETITKESIKVWVTVQGTNERRELGPDEYTIAPDKILNVGENKFIITFVETGSQGICVLTGMQENPTGIKATFTGGDVYTGTQLEKGMFYVEVTYNSGRTEKIDNFTFSPDTVTQVGNNQVQIGYLDFRTNVNVVGIEKPKPAVKLTGVSVSYVGGGLKVGDSLKGSDLLVKAKYDDGSEISLTSDKYQYAPGVFNTAGSQRITVVYGGLTATCEVNVQAVATPQPTPQPTPKPTTPPSTSNPITTNPPTPAPTPKPTQKPSNNGGNNSGGSNNTSKDPIKVDGNPLTSGTGVKPAGKEDIDEIVESIKDALGIVDNNQWEHTTSIGYIRGSNVITDVMNLSNTSGMVNTVDIKGLIENVEGDQKQITVDLINGASGNEITSEMLALLAEKELSLYINMMSPVNDTVALGRWVISGPGLDTTEVTLDPNITYEIIPKESDTLLYIAIANVAYPKGINCQAFPETGTFGSEELVRLYTCTVSKDNAKMNRAFTWQDNTNVININLYDNLYYALSNAVQPYPDSSSLLVELNDVSVEDEPPSIEDTENLDSDESDFDWDTDSDGVSGNDEFDWDEPATTPVPEGADVQKKNIPIVLIAAIAGGVMVLIGIVILIIILTRKSRRTHNDDDFYNESPTADENSDWEDDSDNTEEQDEPDESEPEIDDQE